MVQIQETQSEQLTAITGNICLSEISKQREQEEFRLAGGETNVVVKIGNTVRRPMGPWTPAVHGLLLHLESIGFENVPKVLGIDEKGREVLSFIDGKTGTRPWPEALRTTEGLSSLARLLRKYHDATESYKWDEGTVWAVGKSMKLPGQIIKHADFGPWNTIWRGARPVAIIDFDMAHPGDRLEDLAELAIFGVPLQGEEGAALAGFKKGCNVRKRLEGICRGYGGFSLSDLSRAILQFPVDEVKRMHKFASLGMEPWVSFVQRGRISEFLEYSNFLNENLLKSV